MSFLGPGRDRRSELVTQQGVKTHHVTHVTEKLSTILPPLLKRIFKRDLCHRSQRNFFSNISFYHFSSGVAPRPVRKHASSSHNTRLVGGGCHLGGWWQIVAKLFCAVLFLQCLQFLALEQPLFLSPALGRLWFPVCEHLPVPCLSTWAVPARDTCQFPAWKRLPMPYLGMLASPCLGRLLVPCRGMPFAGMLSLAELFSYS